MISARALLNYILSLCPIDLHCEPFNYTIHHLLNMKNGVKRTLIKACRRVFCESSGKSSERAVVDCVLMKECMWRLCFLLLPLGCRHHFYLIISSKPTDAQRL